MQSKQLKDAIADTMLELLEEKHLDKITVVDLVNRCHVSRQSFYYHYSDTMEVIEYIIEQKVEEAATMTFSASTLEGEIELFIDYYFEFYGLLQRIMLSPRGFNIYLALVKSVRRIIEEYRDSFTTTRKLTIEEGDLLLDFYSHGLVGFLIERRMIREDDKESLVKQVTAILSFTPVFH